jgi:proteasomal ATPase-associated factor 1
LWNVGEGKEIQKWTADGRRAIEALVVLDDQGSLVALGLEGEDRVMLASTKDGVAVVPWTKPGWFIAKPTEVGHQVSMAYSVDSTLIATGHSDGAIALRPLSSLAAHAAETPIKVFRRNEASIYSLSFSGSDLLVGTAAGLPCRVGIEKRDDTITVDTVDEYAGWEAVGVECWTEGNGSIWCAGGEGGIRRY